MADLNEMHTLNDVGSFIWESIKDGDSAEGVVAAVVQEFDVEKQVAELDVKEFLTDLSAFVDVESRFRFLFKNVK